MGSGLTFEVRFTSREVILACASRVVVLRGPTSRFQYLISPSLSSSHDGCFFLIATILSAYTLPHPNPTSGWDHHEITVVLLTVPLNATSVLGQVTFSLADGHCTRSTPTSIILLLTAWVLLAALCTLDPTTTGRNWPRYLYVPTHHKPT